MCGIEMEKKLIVKLTKNFEDFAQNKDGVEFWFARDLQNLLGYDRWENFIQVIEKVKDAGKNSGSEVPDHFRDVKKMISLGKGAETEQRNSRRAAVL